jgi:hypothetical protein
MTDNDFIHRAAVIALVTMAATGLLSNAASGQRQLDLTPRSVGAGI